MNTYHITPIKVLIRKFLSISIYLMISLPGISCDNSSDPQDSNFSFLGFEDKIPVKVIWAEPYLYACAWRDGIWRKKIDYPGSWEYLGLANDSLLEGVPRGVLDAEILGHDIIVAYNGSDENIEPGRTIGIWRSTNDGKDWFRSDDGVPQTITSVYEQNTFSGLKRSPHNSSILFSIVSPAVYKSVDNGYTWNLVKYRRGLLQNLGNIKFNPNREGEVWFYGVTAVMSPFLYCTKDFGNTFSDNVNFSVFGFYYTDDMVLDVSFDAVNPDIVYAVTAQGVIKSTDGGISWFLLTPEIPEEGYITLLEHTKITDEIYALGGNHIFHSNDGLNTVKLLANIPEGSVRSTAMDIINRRIFIGTNKGIYVFSIDQ